MSDLTDALDNDQCVWSEDQQYVTLPRDTHNVLWNAADHYRHLDSPYMVEELTKAVRWSVRSDDQASDLAKHLIAVIKKAIGE
jgi:hypothetical protein